MWATGVVAGASYVYLFDTNISVSSPLASIANVNGSGGLQYFLFTAVHGGHTFKVTMGGYSSVYANYMRIG